MNAVRTCYVRQLSVALGLFAILGIASPGSAGLIYDNGTPPTSGPISAESISDRGVADNFSLASNANLAAVRFWVLDAPGTPASNLDAGSLFLAIYTSTLAFAARTPSFSAIIPTASLTLTPFSSLIDQVEFNLPSPIALTGGTSYLFELHEGNSALYTDSTHVFWIVSSSFTAPGFFFVAAAGCTPAPVCLDTSSSDLAFQLFDSPFAAGVPEPSTVLLLGSGVAGLVGFAKRRGRGK